MSIRPHEKAKFTEPDSAGTRVLRNEESGHAITLGSSQYAALFNEDGKALNDNAVVEQNHVNGSYTVRNASSGHSLVLSSEQYGGLFVDSVTTSEPAKSDDTSQTATDTDKVAANSGDAQNLSVQTPGQNSANDDTQGGTGGGSGGSDAPRTGGQTVQTGNKPRKT